MFRHPSGPVCQQGGPYIISHTLSIQCGAELSAKTAVNHCDSGSLFQKKKQKKGAHVCDINRAMICRAPILAAGLGRM